MFYKFIKIQTNLNFLFSYREQLWRCWELAVVHWGTTNYLWWPRCWHWHLPTLLQLLCPQPSIPARSCGYFRIYSEVYFSSLIQLYMLWPFHIAIVWLEIFMISGFGWQVNKRARGNWLNSDKKKSKYFKYEFIFWYNLV